MTKLWRKATVYAIMFIAVVIFSGCEKKEDVPTAQNGDNVVIDFAGTIDGVAFDGGTASGYPIVLGSRSFIDGFEEQIVGMKVGETKDINVTFPENYGDEAFNGKAAVFKTTLVEIVEEESN